MKKKYSALRWCGLSVFLIVFINSFFLDYIQFGNGVLALPGIGSLYTGLSVFDLISISQVNYSNVAALCTVLLILPFAAGVLLGISGVVSAGTMLPKRLTFAALGMGFLSLIMNSITYFWLADLQFSALDWLQGGVYSVGLGYGYYLNLCLLTVGTALTVCLCVMYPRVAAQWVQTNSASAAHGKTWPTQGSEGVIIGKAGMYRYATFRIKNGEELIIGRDAAMAHIIVDTEAEKMSRKHCSLVFDGSRRQYVVTDYSSNGTYTEDGKRLKNKEMTPLPCGTTIYLGNRKNSFLLN